MDPTEACEEHPLHLRRPPPPAAAAPLLLACALLAPAPAAAQGRPLHPQLRSQIAALRAEKVARTPTQRKLSSRLLYAARMRRGEPVAPGLARLRTGIEVVPDGTTLVDLRADVTPRLLASIATLGGTLVNHFLERGAVRARLPLERLEALAALPEVRQVRPADRAFTRKIDTSEGDVAHRADQARNVFGVDGSSLSIGVLSDGVDALASLQGSGDLPAVTVLAGQAGSGSEGTAMLEIVHDLAPGADLLFATAFNGQASFAANILALHGAGADVIVDDVGYFAEGVFQDDDVADAVNTVTAAGALYFSAAGNAGNWNDGTSGVWEGDFDFTGTTVNGDPAHDFGGDHLNPITKDSPFVFTLQWSDALGASGNDYDLLLVNPPGTQIVAASTDVQDGNDDPFEIIDSFSFNDANRNLVVVRSGGADRFLHVNANRGELAYSTPGQVYGHPAARDAIALAAVDVGDAGAGGVFDGTEPVEPFSSDGPRRVFYEANGTPITPGNFLATGGELRAKPDLAAADCVSTATPGFAVFCGTSAAAPHAAAIAALLLDLGSAAGVTPQQVRDALTGTALDIEAPGPDRDSGAGLIDALAAVDALLPDCDDGIDNDGDGFVDAAADPGCVDALDDTETNPSAPCDDGQNNDTDAFVDYPADPGCADPTWFSESPQCQDGVNNDPSQDAAIDFDGGLSALGYVAAAPDPQCSVAWSNKEKVGRSCGLGFELVLLISLLARLQRTRAPRVARKRG